MDAARILGGLLDQRASRGGGGAGGAILGQVLNGIASAQAQQNHSDPRFAPQNQSPLEALVRESIVRHNQAGGQLSPYANQWINQHGQSYGQPIQPPVVRGAPIPAHHVPHSQHDQHCGLAFNQRVELLLQAMIMATQADAQIDAAEQENIIRQLQPLDRAEADYLRREFGRRHDVHAFAHEVPPGMEHEVYQVSLMAINLDNQLEANYLRALASCLRIEPTVCNQIHLRCGAVLLY